MTFALAAAGVISLIPADWLKAAGGLLILAGVVSLASDGLLVLFR